MTRLRPFGAEIWTAEGPVISFYGFRYPTRMAVIRLAGGRLFVWSPIRLDGDLKEEVQSLGTVSYLVSPNKLHHLFLMQWQRAFPAAGLWASPGLMRKRPDLAFHAPLGVSAPWDQEIAQFSFGGSPFLKEFAFFHHLSRTALFCDLIQNFRPGWFVGWRQWIARLDGITAMDPGAPREWRASFLHRSEARRSLAQLLAMRPQKVVMAHGELVRRGGGDFIRRSFRWL